MKRNKIIYWTSTGLISAGMLLSAFMYLNKNEALMKSFSSIGLPVYFVMLLGVAKLMGAIVLLLPTPNGIKEWAYAGFTFVFIGAAYAHISNNQPWIAPLLFLLLLTVSYFFWRKIRQLSSGSVA